MEVWSLVNSKGGCGKTTLAVNIADCLALVGNRVLLLDTDEQQSAVQWIERSQIPKNFGTVHCNKKNAIISFIQSANSYDYVIIDTPGKLTDIIIQVIRLSNKVIFPISPSAVDFAATDMLVQLLNEWALADPDGAIEYSFLMSRVVPNTRSQKDFHKSLLQFEMPIMESWMQQRIDYVYAANEGLTVFEHHKRECSDEIRRIVNEILTMKKGNADGK